MVNRGRDRFSKIVTETAVLLRELSNGYSLN